MSIKPMVILMQRTLVNGTLLDKGTAGELVDTEHPVAWDGGAAIGERIYLVKFENVDSARGAIKIWLLDEQVFILDGQHAPWECEFGKD